MSFLNAVLPLLFLCCSALTLSLGDEDVLVNHDIEEKEEKEEADDVEKDGKSDTSRGQKPGGRGLCPDPDLSADGGTILGRNFVMEFPMARPVASWGRQFITLVHRNLLVLPKINSLLARQRQT